MRGRWWLNLGLLALVAILAAVAFYQPGHKPPAKAPPLTTLKADAVTHIRIAQPGAKPIVLAKANGRWRMRSPYTLRANAVRIDGLLRLCHTTSHRSFTFKPADAAEYGLDHPRATVRLNDTEIDFGGTQPVNGLRYVRIGDRVHLIGDSITYYLFSRPTAFIDLGVLGPNDHPVGFHLPGLTLTDKDGHWHAEPASALQSTDQVATLIQHWRDAHAIEIRTYTPGKGGKRKPARVTLEFSGHTPQLHFDVVSKKPEFILGRRDAGVEYVLPEDAAQRLLQLKPLTDKPPAKAPSTKGSATGSPTAKTSAHH